MLNTTTHSVLVPRLLPALSDRFMLIDVGASGGISPIWHQFGDRLYAHAFDPLLTEIERLNAAEASGRVRYHAAFVTCRDQRILDGAKADGLFNTTSFHLTSAIRAANAKSIDYTREHFNSGAPVRYTDRYVTIDEHCSAEGLARVDFVKVDTDGHDYYAVRGAEHTLRTRGVLGVQVECPLHGTSHPHANTFASIDRYLRDLGFALFDMDVWRYTRAALPGRFYYDLPASTVSGQVQWLDALYLLDPLTRPALLHGLDQSQIVKLLMLYGICGLPDCAAALMLKLRDAKVEIPGVRWEALLDVLAPTGNYDAYVSEFDRDPTSFYPSRWKATGQYRLSCVGIALRSHFRSIRLALKRLAKTIFPVEGLRFARSTRGQLIDGTMPEGDSGDNEQR